ncbi:PAS domain-containing hybrid sensor histidine kinase/response regulator [Alkalilacustris brevis]|uniref:hybrid sensor histidine kinase/response regulator n=1 Tax=Alkalilacustris brevis TaxID=2026338 RepID=UPI001EE3DD9A|nr:PAS domain-containing hybrid sensor histidine kinase/response regulator [Alkalilacustris brevis]
MIAAAGAGATAWLVAEPMVSLVLASVAATLFCLGLLILWLARRHLRAQGALAEQLDELVGQDAAPAFCTDADGCIGYQNAAAAERFGEHDGRTLLRALGNSFANPAAVLFRLQNRASALGAAREDVVTRQGHVRLSVHRMGAQDFFWRLEEMAERSSSGGRGAEGLSLPMLTASKNGTILFMNDALRRIVGGRMRSIDRVFPYLPLRSGEVTEVSGAEGTLRALVAEVEGASGRREIYLLPMPEGEQGALPARGDFEDLPVALIKAAPDGALIEANRMARDLVGLPPRLEDMPDLALGDLIEGPGRPIRDWLADVMAGHAENRPQTVRARRRDDETHVQVVLRRIAGEGRPGLVAVLQDATELRSLEAQFTQSQKMQAIGQLAGGVAHDFNNLLTAISGHCDLLLLRHDKDDADYADLVQIHQNANRAGSLVGQLLAFSRKQTLKPAVFDLRDTLSDLTHLLNRLVGEKVTFTLSHDSELHMVRADRRQMEQVLVNLVVNARDAMPQGGEIRLSTANRTLREDLERDRARVPAGDYVVIEVSDQGEGIAPDKIDKVFEPFFTTKRAGEGTGLGLSTAYGIIKQTGGFIFADSVAGQGATFSIYLPACDFVPEPAPPRPAPSARPVGAGEGVILLVEDEAPVRAFASRALRMRGYTVIEADSAERALETLRDPALKVDLFLTDVIMPGKDGPSWVREALSDRPGAKVIFVSGYAEDALSGGAAQIPNSAFLPKPFSLNELAEMVERQIH